MPACPHCGDEYPKGGAFHTHTQNCALAPEADDEAEVDTESLAARLSALENEFSVRTARKHRVEVLSDRVEELEEKVDRLEELNRELFEFAEIVVKQGGTGGRSVEWDSHPDGRKKRTQPQSGD
jgi:hypothetical protein